MNDHINKSNHDSEVANILSTNLSYCDWRLVCVFYSVIHRIDAYAHKIGRERELVPSSIEEEGKWYDLRRKFVKNHLKEYYGLYDRLYNMSRDCRYNPKYYQYLANYPAYTKNLFESVEKFKTIT